MNYNADNQNRSSLDSNNNTTGTILQQQQLMVSDADTQLLTENANTGFDIANEIKRWQQLHQSNNNGTSSTALLSNVGTNLQHDDTTDCIDEESIDHSLTEGNLGIPIGLYRIPLCQQRRYRGEYVEC